MPNRNFVQARALESLADAYFSTGQNANAIYSLSELNFSLSHLQAAKLFTCPACLHSMQYCGSFFGKSGLGQVIPVYYCEACGTIRTPQNYSGQQVSVDTEEFAFLNNSLEDHLNFENRNRGLARALLDNFPLRLSSVVEVGCGPGWLLDEAQKRGIKCVGYDLATDSVEYGRNNLQLDLRNEFFSLSTHVVPFDLLICIMVFEHLQDPHELAAAISYHCMENKAPALISVPITENLDTIVESFKNIFGSQSLFCYSPAHTCHYTQNGFALFWKRYGACKISRLTLKRSWPFLFLVYFS